MPALPRTAERYARGVVAALVAVGALLLAANAGPARAAEEHPGGGRTGCVAECDAGYAP
ncbi:hypothetical protein ACGFZL_04440 [Streptomyces sp. NPDC048182]|uniref:hypothetical protein n=1 Tax=Streptomyces sp. NPDC048182 TaxID=3365507 RepID=UPI003710719F